SEMVRKAPEDMPVLDWAPDGTYLVGTRQVQQSGFDLVKWDGRGPEAKPRVLYATPADEFQPRVSPDGGYLAYRSNRSRRAEVHLARLPAMTMHVQASLDGTE